MPSYDSDQPLVFIHIPKTGGVTVRTILTCGFPPADVKWIRSRPDFDDEALCRYKLVAGHYSWNRIASMYSSPPQMLTWLRNPLERVLSQFHYIKEIDIDQVVVMPRERERAHQVAAMSLEEFATKEGALLRRYRNDVHMQFLSGRPELPEVPALGLKHLEQAKQRLAETVFFGLTERMFESILMLTDLLGLPMPESVPWRNRTRYKPRTDDLSETLKSTLREANKFDLQLYRYAEEVFEQRWQRWLLRCSDAAFRYRLSRDKETLPNSRAISMDQPFAGSGWHEPEIAKRGSAYRWSGPGRRCSVDLTVNTEEPLRLKFRVLPHFNADLLDNLQLSVNGHVIQLEKPTKKGGTFLVEGDVPNAALVDAAGLLRLVFQVGVTRKPSEVNSRWKDDRSLGLAFAYLEVFPREPDDSSLAA